MVKQSRQLINKLDVKFNLCYLLMEDVLLQLGPELHSQCSEHRWPEAASHLHALDLNIRVTFNILIVTGNSHNRFGKGFTLTVNTPENNLFSLQLWKPFDLQLQY